MMMEFDTFISYSTKDKPAADAACAILENAGVRCWIAPRDIMPGAEWGAAIVNAIDNCRVMVLIFSSNANESRQIRREVERAVSRGIPIVPVRIENVMPTESLAYFIGTVHWLDALTPPIEKHLERLARSVQSLLQINPRDGDERDRKPPPSPSHQQGSAVAAIPIETLGEGAVNDHRRVPPLVEPLDQVKTRAGISRRAALLGVFAAAIALLIGGSLYHWGLPGRSGPAKSAYYRQLIWRWGIPEGLDPIDEQTRAHLDVSYRVASRNSKVVEARRQNSLGLLRADGEGHARWAVDYGADGGTKKIEIFDADDGHVRDGLFAHPPAAGKVAVAFERDNKPVALIAMRRSLQDPLRLEAPTGARSEIPRLEVTFDATGFPIEQRYLNLWGDPQYDAEGKFGERFVHSPEGLILRRADIGANGDEITLRTGLRAVAFSYDRDHRLIRQTLIGADDKPLDGLENFAYLLIEYDDWGNAATTTSYNADGRPALRKDGYSRVAARRDQRGQLIELTGFGTDGRPTLNKEGYAKITFAYDARAKEIERAYFSVDGNPTLNKDAYAKVAVAYDARGNPVDRAFLGSTANQC